MTSKSTPPSLVHKSVGIQGCKVLDSEEGIVEAFVSGIGNKDSVGDIIQPGAFNLHLRNRKPKGVWSHDWDRPVSKTLDIYEVPVGDSRLPLKMQLAGIGGLYVKTQFNLATQSGRDAYETVKFFGDEAEWSIGYQVHDQEYDKSVKAMLLKEIELFEYSPVLFGANELTSTVSIKAHKGNDGDLEFDIDGLDEVGEAAVKAALDVILKEKSVTLSEEDDYDEKPWHVEKRGSQYCVIKNDNGDNEGCHSTRKEANAQLAALHAAEAGKMAEIEDVDTKVDALQQGEAEMATTPPEGEKGYSVYQNGDLFMVVDDSTGEVEKFFTNIDMAELYAAKENAEELAEMAEEAYEEAEDAAEMAAEGETEKSIDDDAETKVGDPAVEAFVLQKLHEIEEKDAEEADVSEEPTVDEQIKSVGEMLAAADAKMNDIKAGRVLSTKNRNAIETAVKALQDVLEADVPSVEADEKVESDDTDVKDADAEVEVKDAEVDIEEKDAEEVVVDEVVETETKDDEPEVEEKEESSETDEKSDEEDTDTKVEEVDVEEKSDEEDDSDIAAFMQGLAEFEEILLDID